MSAAPTSRRSAFGLLAAVIVLWGLNWPLMKFGLRHMAPLTFVTARMALAALCMAGFVAALGRLHRPSRQDWPIVLWIGGVQMAGFTGLITVALQYVEAGRSAILSYTTPLWVVPGAMLLLGERLAGRRLAGFLTGMAGVGVLFNPLGFDWSSRTALIGNGLLMLAAMLWAAVIVAIKRHPWHSPALDLAPWHFLVATLAVAPFALAAEAGRPVDWGWELGGILAYNGLAATAFCYLAAISVNRALPAITTALGMLGVPVAGLVFSAILLGEPVSASEAAGLGLIIAGLALVALGDSREAADPGAPSLQG